MAVPASRGAGRGDTYRGGGRSSRGKGRKRARKDPSPELELDDFGQPVRARALSLHMGYAV